MNIVYLASISPERAADREVLKREGHTVIHTDSFKRAAELLEKGGQDVLVYEWPFGDRMKWIRRQFVAIGRDPLSPMEKWVGGLTAAVAGIAATRNPEVKSLGGHH